MWACLLGKCRASDRIHKRHNKHLTGLVSVGGGEGYGGGSCSHDNDFVLHASPTVISESCDTSII